jgi:uncharacterized membrane protein YgdD (TMEM256/DUF423 family)
LSGASAVAMGSYGAHGIKYKNDTYKDIFKTGNLYHLVHATALLPAALHLKGRKRAVVCGCLMSGIVLFSGSCYTVGIVGERKPYSYPAPIGGMLLIGGWLAVAIL